MSAPPLIHVVDDDAALRTALLRAAGFEARGYASTGDFLLHPPPDRPGCVLLDVRMPGPSGLELQAALQRQGVALAQVVAKLGGRLGGRARPAGRAAAPPVRRIGRGRGGSRRPWSGV